MTVCVKSRLVIHESLKIQMIQNDIACGAKTDIFLISAG